MSRAHPSALLNGTNHLSALLTIPLEWQRCGETPVVSYNMAVYQKLLSDQLVDFSFETQSTNEYKTLALLIFNSPSFYVN